VDRQQPGAPQWKPFCRAAGVVPAYRTDGSPVRTSDTLAARLYVLYLRRMRTDPRGWALARLLLRLHSQWWWVDVPLTPFHRHVLASEIVRHYENERLRYACETDNPHLKSAMMPLLIQPFLL
jgi:hypothetical protein